MSSYWNRKYISSIPGQRWYERRKRRRTQRANFEPPFKNMSADQITLEHVALTDYLLDTFDRMKQENGKAPGPDGLSFCDYSRGEIATELRKVSQSILEGSYRPDRARQLRIPKQSGGHRTLKIRNMIDRIVSKAIADFLMALLDHIFLPGVMGFRPKRGVWMLLAMLEATVIHTGQMVIAQTDIRHAFDNVRINALMEEYRRHIKDIDMLRLIETVLRGHQGSNRTVGIDQGDPLSPFSLNLRLHHCLDRPFDADPDHPPWFRYADNLVYLCQSVPEGHQAIQRASQLLLPAGFSLKEKETSVVDLLYGNQTTILGFAVSRPGRSREAGRDSLRFGLTSASWKSLEEALMLAHQTSNPPRTASEAVQGWIQAWGPAFESERERHVLKGVRRRVARMGFRKIDMERTVLDPLRSARERWRKLRDRVCRDFKQSAMSLPRSI